MSDSFNLGVGDSLSYEELTPISPEEFFAGDAVSEPTPNQVKLILEGIAYQHDGPYAMAGASFWEIPDRVYVSGEHFRNGPPLGVATVRRLNNGNLHARVDVVDPQQLVGRAFLAIAVRLPNLTADNAVDPMAGGVIEGVMAFNPVEDGAAFTRYRILDPAEHVDCPELFRDYNRVLNRQLNRWEWRHNEETAHAGRV